MHDAYLLPASMPTRRAFHQGRAAGELCSSLNVGFEIELPRPACTPGRDEMRTFASGRSIANFGPDTSLPTCELFCSVRSNTTEAGWIDSAPTS